MPIVGGLDIHRKQITFDYLDTATGQVRRGQVSPADREHLRAWLARFAGREGVAFAVEGCAGWRYVVEELAALQVIPGPRRAHPGTYDAWVRAMQAVDPRFSFTDPPFRHSLAMTLALAAAETRPAAVLTGPAIAAQSQAWPIRRSRSAETYGMVQVSLQHHPLTASAALVWSGDLSRPLQQMLFDTADELTEPTRPQPADLVSSTTA